MAGIPHLLGHERRPLHHWWLIILLAIVACAMGVVGFHQYETLHHPPAVWSTAVFHSLRLFIMETPPLYGEVPVPLEAARWLAPLLCLWVAWRASLSLFGCQLRLAATRFWSNHVVVCGLGRTGLHLVQHFRHQNPPRRVVVIEKEPAGEFIEMGERLGAAVLAGNATDKATLAWVRAERADTVIAACGEDLANLQIAQSLNALAESARDIAETARSKCFVRLSDYSLRSALREALDSSSASANGPPAIAVKYFNGYEASVRDLLYRWPLDGDGITASDTRRLRLVVIGFGRMGSTLALMAMHQAHFANRTRLRIEVIDRQASNKECRFLYAYPQVNNLCDIAFHQWETESPTARDALRQWSRDRGFMTKVAICFDDDHHSLELVMRLRCELCQNHTEMAVRLSEDFGLDRLLAKLPNCAQERCATQRFGHLEKSYGSALLENSELDAMAKAIHQVYLEHEIRAGRLSAQDEAHQAWEQLNDLYKDSNRQQADHMAIKLRAIGCEIVPVAVNKTPDGFEFSGDEMELLAQMEHRRWVAERIIEGWQHASGPENPHQKTSPYLCDWDNLDEAARDKDRESIRHIPEILAKAGNTIRRKKA